jgi:hypothetical protein
VRHAPDRSLPPYAFLPGRDPHPTRDPSGHSFEASEQELPYLPAEVWPTNEEYLFGVDLYNHGFLWEAHEAWEGVWNASKHDPLQKEHLQGLIQCAAACLKIRMEQPRGLARLSELGTARLEGVARKTGGQFMGIDLMSFVADLRSFASSEPSSIDGRPPIELED